MIFKTRTRHKLIGSDYSAQEPRLTAFMSQDAGMMQAYKEGKDLYAVIAQSMYNNEYWENLEFYPEGMEIELDGKKIICGKKTHLHEEGKARRSSAKTMLLAILYGMSPATAGRRMGKTPEEGKALMDNFFSKFPAVKQLIDDSRAQLVSTGYVEDWAGRRRHLPDIFLAPYEVEYKDQEKQLGMVFNPFLECDNRSFMDDKLRNALIQASKLRGNKQFDKLAEELSKEGVTLSANTGRIAQAERQCLNARIQGGAASLTKLAMVNIQNNERLQELDAHLIITVHDEVLVECPAAYADEVEKLLPQIMIDTAKPYINVPMACDPYCVDRWYADVAGSSLRKEYKKLEEKAEEAGTSLTRDELIAKLVKKHPEYTEACIMAAISSDDDIVL